MKKILTFALIAAPILFACNNADQAKSETTSSVSAPLLDNLEVSAFVEKMGDDAVQIVDVRTPSEWSGGVIEGAIRMNILDVNFKEQIATLDKNRPVLVYCKSGGRSSRAAGVMSSEGFQEVYNLLGGITAWQKAGKPIVD